MACSNIVKMESYFKFTCSGEVRKGLTNIRRYSLYHHCLKRFSPSSIKLRSLSLCFISEKPAQLILNPHLTDRGNGDVLLGQGDRWIQSAVTNVLPWWNDDLKGHIEWSLREYTVMSLHNRSHWPCGLRFRSVAALLLGLRVRIRTWEWMFVCCECCVLSGRGLCDELITRSEDSYRLWCVVVCDLETSCMRRPWPIGGMSRQKQKKTVTSQTLNELEDLQRDVRIFRPKVWHFPRICIHFSSVFLAAGCYAFCSVNSSCIKPTRATENLTRQLTPNGRQLSYRFDCLTL